MFELIQHLDFVGGGALSTTPAFFHPIPAGGLPIPGPVFPVFPLY